MTSLHYGGATTTTLPFLRQDERPPCCAEPELFWAVADPPRRGDDRHHAQMVANAKDTCGLCPHITGCLEHALGRREAGVWGGLTEVEREVVRRRRKMGRDETTDVLRPVSKLGKCKTMRPANLARSAAAAERAADDAEDLRTGFSTIEELAMRDNSNVDAVTKRLKNHGWRRDGWTIDREVAKVTVPLGTPVKVTVPPGTKVTVRLVES